MGLPEFKESKIRSALMGVKVTITKAMIVKITGFKDNGMFFTDTDKTIKTSEWGPIIHKALFEGRLNEKCVNLVKEHMVHHKHMIICFMPREGGTDYMSWDHKHFLRFLVKNFPINLPTYISEHMCNSIREGIKGKRTVPYTRLISVIIHQGGLLQRLHDLGISSDEHLCTCTGRVNNGTMLGSMKIIGKKDVIIFYEDLKLYVKTTELIDEFPPISMEDHPIVFAEYIVVYYKKTVVLISWD